MGDRNVAPPEQLLLTAPASGDGDAVRIAEIVVTDEGVVNGNWLQINSAAESQATVI